MSKFDIVHSELCRKRWGLAALLLLLFGLSFAVVSGLGNARLSEQRTLFWVAVTALTVVTSLVAAHWLPPCRALFDRVQELQREIDRITNRVAEAYSGLPKRQEGERFKNVLRLAGRKVDDFEFAMAAGMLFEQKEVWVTAFCRRGKVLKVFASIGSKNRCGPSENVYAYPEHIRRLSCDEVRQYHNHPGTSKQQGPSPNDKYGAAILDRFLDVDSARCGHYIVYHNAAGEYRILEYDSEGKTRLVFEFDACSSGQDTHL